VTGPVSWARDDTVVTVTLDRPKALNALSTELAAALAETVEQAASTDGVRALVLTGAGDRGFCAGADLRQRADLDDHGWFVQREVLRRAFAAVRRCPLPTVAAVFGYTLGGGTELALSCDLVVAADDTVMGLPEVTLGLVPGGGGTQLLARRVGAAAAKELILTGRRVDAAEALRIGLVNRVTPRKELLGVAHTLAGEVAANAPTATRLAKWAVDLGAGLALEAGIEVEDQAWRRAVLSDDRREGIAAWSDRRAPDWPGR
jgi:enoyl-CoA hydratase/carnithine racemase